MNSPLNKLKETIARLRAGHNSRSPLYGRSAGSTLGLYLLCMAGVVLATFLIFLLGYNIYSALRDHATYYYYDFITPFIVLPLYSLMRGVRDMALLFVVLLLGSGWLGVTWAFFRLYQRDLTKVVQAAGTLMDPDAAPPELPSALAPAEAALRLARQQVQHSEALAREAEQRKNDLIVYLAHDLKTPLTSVIGYLTLLQDEPQISPELRARYTGIALDKAERLEDLINEFFDITRFNLSHIELERRPTDLTRMLEQVVSEFGPMLAAQDLTCRTDLPPKLVYNCDADKMARVLDNLLRNACHYSYPGTVIEVAAGAEADAVVLRFANAGPTIPPEKLDRIFEQFFRLDSSRASRTGGAGLGLAIARQIVELHGGSITAESADEHIVFTVRLPFDANRTDRAPLPAARKS